MYGDGGSAHDNHYSPNTCFNPPHPHPQLNQRQQSSGRLTRFNSAPNSFFQTLLDDDCSFLPLRSNEILSAGQPLQSFTHQDQEQHNIIKHETVDGFASLRNINNNSSSSGSGALLRQSSSPADFLSSVFDDNVASASYRGNSQAPHHIQSNHHPMPSIPEFQQHHTVSGLLGESYADCWLGKRRSGDLGNEIETVSNELGHQNGYSANASNNGLIHQMSLPNTSSEFAAVNKYLQFQGSSTSTPCSSTRAKRGFATHPRSIAERVRRTKISDRMRKLQQLFPEIDKQTNTAQMLDMATDYIKDLEKEVKSLTDTHSKCKCLRKRQ